MIARVHDTAFRVMYIGKTIKQKAFPQVTPGAACGNRTHDLRITRAAHTTPSPRYLRLRCSFGSLDGAATASLDASSRHNPCHDSSSNEGWTTFRQTR